MWHIQYSKYGGQSKGCGPSPNVSVLESSRDSGDDYREKPEGRGARQTERDLESRDSERETHWEGSRPPPAAELVGGGSSSTGHGKGDWGEWDTKR